MIIFAQTGYPYVRKAAFRHRVRAKIAMGSWGKWKSCIILELDNGPKRPAGYTGVLRMPSARNRPTTERARKTRGHRKRSTRNSAPFANIHHHDTGRSLIPNQAAQTWGDPFRPKMKENPRHRGLSCLRAATRFLCVRLLGQTKTPRDPNFSTTPAGNPVPL